MPRDKSGRKHMVQCRRSKITTNNNKQHTTKTQQMSRHWLRQYTTYDIDAKKLFKPYRIAKNSLKKPVNFFKKSKKIPI